MSNIIKYQEFLREKYILSECELVTYLNEAIIKTYPIKTTIKLLKREFINFYSDFEEETGTIFIKIDKSIIDKTILSKIISFLNIYGYFPSLITLYDKSDVYISNYKWNQYKNILDDIYSSNFKYLQIDFESKYNHKLKSCPILYHITEEKYLDDILKNGLLPRSLNKKAYHPERIYLGFNETDCVNLLNQFGKGNYSLLKIQSNSTNIYSDPDYINGCWTYDFINPKDISHIKNISI